MNEQQALDYASDNLITVTTDVKTKSGTYFLVGTYRVQNFGRLWRVLGKHQFTGRRGDCIYHAVIETLNDRSDES